MGKDSTIRVDDGVLDRALHIMKIDANRYPTRSALLRQALDLGLESIRKALSGDPLLDATRISAEGSLVPMHRSGSTAWDPTLTLYADEGEILLCSRPYPVSQFRLLGIWAEPLGMQEGAPDVVFDSVRIGGSAELLPCKAHVDQLLEWPHGHHGCRNPGLLEHPIVRIPNRVEIRLGAENGTGPWVGRVYAIVAPLPTLLP